MSMFCYQCQETAKGTGCTLKGVCGKTENVANLQDLLIYTLKGIAIYAVQARERYLVRKDVDQFIMESLFSTITNANFDKQRFVKRIQAALELREDLKQAVIRVGGTIPENLHDAATWTGSPEEFEAKAALVGVLATENEDVRSLRELLIYGLKGMAAYAEHAYTLQYKETEIFAFIEKALVATLDDTLETGDLVALVLEAGKHGVDVMALLDKANTTTYGNPELTKVNIGVRTTQPFSLVAMISKISKSYSSKRKELVWIFTHMAKCYQLTTTRPLRNMIILSATTATLGINKIKSLTRLTGQYS